MDREKYLSATGAEYIRAMFANTGADGALTLREEGKEPVTWYMRWTEADMEEIVRRYEALEAVLTRLGREHRRWEDSPEEMTEDLKAAWNIFVVPYPHHGMDEEQLAELALKEELGDALTEEEEKLLEKRYEWLAKNALTRLPKDRCNPLFLIQRGRRYEKLVTLGAPKVVLDSEARCLAEELALYHGLMEVN